MATDPTHLEMESMLVSCPICGQQWMAPSESYKHPAQLTHTLQEWQDYEQANNIQPGTPYPRFIPVNPEPMPPDPPEVKASEVEYKLPHEIPALHDKDKSQK